MSRQRGLAFKAEINRWPSSLAQKQRTIPSGHRSDTETVSGTGLCHLLRRLAFVAQPARSRHQRRWINRSTPKEN